MKYLRNGKAEVKTLGEMLQNTILSVKREGKKDKGLREKWKKIAGDMISSHTKVGMVKRGILHIEVDSAAWLHHISGFKKEELLSSIQKEFKRGYISDIKFRVSTF